MSQHVKLIYDVILFRLRAESSFFWVTDGDYFVQMEAFRR